MSELRRRLEAHVHRSSVDGRLLIQLTEDGTSVVAYRHQRGHYHFVSDGRLAEHAHELSLRLPGALDTPPEEGSELMRRLLRELRGRSLASMHTVVLEPSPFASSALRGIALVEDPELGPWVLQCVGITAGEARAAVLGSTEAIVAPLRQVDPLLTTHPKRAELPLPVAVGVPTSEGHEVPTLRFFRVGERYELELEPTRIRATLVAHLQARLAGGAAFRVTGPGLSLRVERAATSRVEIEDRPEPLLRIQLDGSDLSRLALDSGVGDLVLGPVRIRFIDEPAPAPGPLVAAEVERVEAPSPPEARIMAETAARENRLEEALALLPIAVRDGAHGLLAELLWIDVLRRMGRTNHARAQLWRTADAWLGGERPQIWNTQWQRLVELAKKLKLDLRDPRLLTAAARAR